MTMAKKHTLSMPSSVPSLAEIALAGGGLVGLSAALACAKAGWRVAVVEPHAPSTHAGQPFDGRVSAIALSSAQWLESLGVWKHLDGKACPILNIRITDNQVDKGAAKPFVHYHHADVTPEPMGYIVENRHLRHALWQAVLATPGIAVHTARIVQASLQGGGRQLLMDDGMAMDCSLLLVAEGKHSPLREAEGIITQQHDYRQTAIVATIAHAKPHQFVAQERFYPAGPFAILPMTDPAPGEENAGLAHRSSIVWTENARFALAFLSLPPEELQQEVRRRFGDFLGEIAVVPPLFHYPLSRLRANRLTAPHLALIGDAAHAIHPIAGQGVNLGFRDVMELEVLLASQRKLGLNPGATTLLEEYQRNRAVDIESMLTATHHINGLFANSSPVLGMLRRAGMGLAERTPPLKQVMMRHAMGMLL